METIGRYQILERVASGGMAEVLIARTTGEGGFEKLVAIKRILRHLAGDEVFVRMFIDEARISATLSHANIAQIFEFGKAGPTYFIAMEYVLGPSLVALYRHFRERGELPPAGLVAYLMASVCAALEYAHSKRDDWGKPLEIIHRDVSPANVLVSLEGEVKLIDFGIAKAARRLEQTVGRELKGKLSYMSPEQATGGRNIDHRSDIFCVGIMLVELLSGHNPFRGESPTATLERVRYARVPPAPPHLRGDHLTLYQLAQRALARDPADRYPSAGELLEQLEPICQDRGFGTRQLGHWMKEIFADEEQELRRRLLRARQAAKAEEVSGGELMEEEDDDEELPTRELQRPKPSKPSRPARDEPAKIAARPIRTAPEMLGPPPAGSRVVEPVEPVEPVAQAIALVVPKSRRPDPSSKVAQPLGRAPATPRSTRATRPPRNGLLFPTLIFAVLAAALAVGFYIGFG